MWTRLSGNLHVRVSALFMGLLVVVGAVYYLWMTSMVFAPPAQDPVEEHWYSELADAEVDSLAREATLHPDRLDVLAQDYGRTIAGFEAEVVFFDSQGQVLASSDPDSLGQAIGVVDPTLLTDMTSGDWAFDEVYPDPTNIDAYVNRIFHVARFSRADGEAAFLAATWKPLIFSEADVQLDARKLWLQAVLVALIASFAMGWIVMSWLTRRIHHLSLAVDDLARGQLDRRVHDDSRDDIGRLGRDFNTMAARVEQLVEDLRGKEQFQRQLVANVSHDLRTPLSSVRGYIETLAIRGHDLPAADYQKYLGIVTDNLLHLDHLVDHLLQLSRLDSGQARFSLEEFPLPELVEGILARATVAADRKGITVACDCPDDLPMVVADPLQIVQVLQNLVDNGVKFGKPGGTVTVAVHDGHDGFLDVAVHDDGQGIAPEVLPHIFERFFSGDASRSTKGQSSGLGLAISQKIIEGHGGRITVESEVGRGTCFRFRLRAADQELLEAEAES